jgi:CheY-like chemotaxis protein
MSGTLPKCVLVVDDDEGVALTFSRMLRLQGYRVETARSGSGLALATAHKPDAIIPDLRMPIFGGVEFLRPAHTDADGAPCVTIVGDYFIEEPIASEPRQLGAQSVSSRCGRRPSTSSAALAPPRRRSRRVDPLAGSIRYPTPCRVVGRRRIPTPVRSPDFCHYNGGQHGKRHRVRMAVSSSAARA